MLTVSGPAFAQDSIYWTNSDAVEPSIAKVGLNGTDAEVLIGDLGALNMPRGITMNPAAETIYWSNSGNDNIARAELNGCCAQILTSFTLGPHAMTIQPELGNLYWTNAANGTIGKSQLNGQSALQLSGGGAPVNGPTGIALNRASGRLYWVNYNDNTVGYMDSADGSNGGQLVTGASPVSQPVGLAIDTINNRALWTNTATNDIGYSNLDGTGVDSGTFNVGSAPIDAPDTSA